MGDKINKTFMLWKTEGLDTTFRYCLSYLCHRLFRKPLLSVDDICYQKWRRKNALTPFQLESMREEAERLPYRPLMSILMPVFNTNVDFLRLAVDSVKQQVYSNWELCIGDDCSDSRKTKAELLKVAADKKVKVRFLERNSGIAGASNAALEMAAGDFVALLDHDDELSPDALFEFVKLLNQHPDADFIYSDEDKLDESGRNVEAFLKPDWSPEFLLANMYTCHLGVYRRNLLKEIDGFRVGFDGAQDFDLVLRLTERTQKIHHIPKILYHWRRTRGSTSIEYQSSTGGKSAAEASKKALQDAMQRREIAGTVEPGKFAGTYRIRPTLPPESLVSIIICTRDGIEYLSACVDSIFRLTRQPKYEIIIIDNDSVEASTKEYLSALMRDQKVQVIPFPGEFNFTEMNNLAASRAGGDSLLFLNNDTRIIDGGWLHAMLEMLQLPHVGVAGAKLLYPDDTVQHAGVVLWHCGTAGYVHSRLPRKEHGYFGMADTIRNCSAVSAACMLVKRNLFEQLGGFDKSFKVSYQDVDFCLRAGEAGYRTVFTPFAELSHLESASTGRRKNEDEERLFSERWKQKLSVDPYYSRNFPSDHLNFRLE